MIYTFFPRTALSLKRYFDRRKAASELQLISKSKGAFNTSAPLVFAVLRNEMLRLPAFFRHYDELGVRNYIIVDNNSTDGTADYLSSQSNVCLYAANSDFVGKERWVNYLIYKYGKKRWCLVADADELLDYPHSDKVKLPALCRYLEQTGSNAIHAVLLDMYPDCPLEKVNYQSGDQYFERNWYLDPFDSLEKAPRVFYRGSGLDYRFKGGMRKRVFGVSPCCSKFPLFRFSPPMFLTDGQHYLEGGHISPLRAVLYHFKYLQDFAPHVHEEAKRAQYLWAADEYQAYTKCLGRDMYDFTFLCDSSLQFEGIQQLENYGFVTCPTNFTHYAQTLEGKSRP